MPYASGSEQWGMDRVLLVDDDAEFADTVRELVAAEFPAVELLWAPGRDEAMALMAKHEFRLVLSDYRLEGKNGLDVLEEIEATYDRPHRVMVTAYPDFRIAMQAIRRGKVSYFLTKPLHVGEFSRVLAASMA